jgi:hypothetical protein
MGRDLDRENTLLAAELGMECGQPRYQWRFSENLYFPMRDGNKWDYVADESTGIIVAKPVFVLRKMAPLLHRQWVMCLWMNPGTERDWKDNFGAKAEYPRNGYYAPTSIELDEGINPWDTNEGKSVTYWFLAVARKDAAKSKADLDAEGLAIIEHNERKTDHQMDELIGDCLLPFGHIPGSRAGGISLPTPDSAANHDAAFEAAPQV